MNEINDINLVCDDIHYSDLNLLGHVPVAGGSDIGLNTLHMIRWH